MLLLLQNVLYCLLYASLIKCAVRNDGRNCLYFYPKEYIEEAQKRGIADKETVMKRSKWFMIPFCIIIFVALILIISVWNHVMDFKTAYLQACLFLVVMNWFDGIVIDRLWVEHSRIWHIDGMGGIPYVYNHIAEKSHMENEMSKMNLPETVPARNRTCCGINQKSLS